MKPFGRLSRSSPFGLRRLKQTYHSDDRAILPAADDAGAQRRQRRQKSFIVWVWKRASSTIILETHGNVHREEWQG